MKYIFNLIDKLQSFFRSEKFEIAVLLIFFWIPFNFVTFALWQWSEEMLQLTNVFFAVMCAAGAICFTYSRAIEVDDKKVMRMIVGCGERYLLAALLFIFSSGFKFYVLIAKDSKSLFVNYTTITSIICSMILTTLASTLCLMASRKLITHLKQRVLSEVD